MSCRRRRSRRRSRSRRRLRGRREPRTTESRSPASRSAEAWRCCARPTPALADHVSVVVCVAPYSDLAKVMLLATTGTYRYDDRRQALSGAAVSRGRARTFARGDAAAERRRPPPSARSCEGSTRHSERALEFREHAFRAAGAEALALFELLSNRDPKRFDALYAALPEHVRATVAELSPLRHAPQPPRTCRDRDGTARPLLPRRRVASARRSLTARPAHGDVAARARDAASERPLPRRARTAERLLRPRPGSRGLAAAHQPSLRAPSTSASCIEAPAEPAAFVQLPRAGRVEDVQPPPEKPKPPRDELRKPAEHRSIITPRSSSAPADRRAAREPLVVEKIGEARRALDREHPQQGHRPPDP